MFLRLFIFWYAKKGYPADVNQALQIADAAESPSPRG